MAHQLPNGTVPVQDLHYIMANDKIGTQYEPIVDIISGKIYAWEALARFIGRNGALIPPNLVFQALHYSPLSLFQMELRIKQFQLSNAPDTGYLFINIDQDAFDVFNEDLENPLVDIIANNNRAVVEIIENSSISDARISATMGDIYSKLGVPLALDDLGANNSLVDLNLLPKVDFIKLSLDWMKRIANKDDRTLLETLIGYARKTGKKTILEGVETSEHLNLAHALGVDYAQGYLFKHMFREQYQHEPVAAISMAAKRSRPRIFTAFSGDLMAEGFFANCP